MDPSLAPERALVTGASGFVGANLVRRLLALGASVHALVRPSSTMERLTGLAPALVVQPGDLLDPRALAAAAAAASPTLVFHLAASSGHARDAWARDEALRVAALGTWNLLRATAAWPRARFVHVGSSLEYGPRERALRESDPLLPSTSRGVAKACAALLCREAAAGGRPVVVVRPFSVYGPWESPARFVPTAIRAALLDHELPLTPRGYRRDYVYVDDVVEGILAAARTPGVEGECFNLGTGVQWANEELVEQVGKATGRPVRVRAEAFPPSPSDVGHWVADPSWSRERLGWTARHDLAAGLAATVAWLRERLDVC